MQPLVNAGIGHRCIIKEGVEPNRVLLGVGITPRPVQLLPDNLGRVVAQSFARAGGIILGIIPAFTFNAPLLFREVARAYCLEYSGP